MTKAPYKSKKPYKGTKYYCFEKAKEIVRAHQIPTIAIYSKWHKHNKPVGIPPRPDRIYLAYGWINWNDYLGNDNPFSKPKNKFLSYEETKKLLKPFKFKSSVEYKIALKEKTFNFITPYNPDFAFKDWISWKDFLGNKSFEDTIESAISITPVIYITKNINQIQNVYTVDINNNGEKFIEDCIKDKIKIIAVFNINNKFDLSIVISKYAKKYWEGSKNEYIFNNINAFIFEISNYLDPFSNK